MHFVWTTVRGQDGTATVQAGGQRWTLEGLVDCGTHLLLSTQGDVLPCDIPVIVRVPGHLWHGYLTDERVWEDGSISYQLGSS